MTKIFKFVQPKNDNLQCDTINAANVFHNVILLKPYLLSYTIILFIYCILIGVLNSQPGDEN